MIKKEFLAIFMACSVIIPFTANAAYPVYNQAYNSKNMNYATNRQITQQRSNIQPQQLAAASATNGRSMTNSVAATNPNRVTGALPRVGSSATNAGRQYYQSTDYDRLAESGLYIGLSAAYTAMTYGEMSADYASETNAFFAPGSFKPSKYKKDTMIPFQISVGAAINSDIRVDFSYLRYSGLSYDSKVQTSDGAGGFTDTSVSGGAITSNSTMLNLYYNIDSLTGYMAGGSLRPYVGAGVGLALNTIADYVVFDETFYDETGGLGPSSIAAGELTGISDIYAYHNGGTMEQLAFSLEAGVTTEMNGGLKLDFYIRYANLGKIKTSGSIVVSQTEWLSDGAGDEYEAPYDSVFHYTNWFESGTLSNLDLGVRLRLEF